MLISSLLPDGDVYWVRLSQKEFKSFCIFLQTPSFIRLDYLIHSTHSVIRKNINLFNIRNWQYPPIKIPSVFNSLSYNIIFTVRIIMNRKTSCDLRKNTRDHHHQEKHSLIHVHITQFPSLMNSNLWKERRENLNENEKFIIRKKHKIISLLKGQKGRIRDELWVF